MKKQLLTILLAVAMLFGATIVTTASASISTELAQNDGLGVLSPMSFFEEKYTFFNAVDEIDTGSTWISYFFRATNDVTWEEVQDDAESYRQALVNSGYFVRTSGKMNLTYIGKQEVSTATVKGRDQGWHVNVNAQYGWESMGIPPAITVNLVKGFSFFDVETSVEQEEPVVTEKPAVSNNSKQEVAEQRTPSNVGEIAWDDGRMIADPGDFLGYEIEVTETSKGTNAGGGFIKYKYESIPTTDIQALVDAISESPYFEANGGIQCEYYWLLCFNYIGPDEDLTALCASMREENNGRDSDFSIYIFDPYSSESKFSFYQYPGFTINSEPAQPNPDPDPDDLFETCGTCFGDGKCNICDGRGKQRFYNATQGWYEVDCSCNSGRCRSCNGSGHK